MHAGSVPWGASLAVLGLAGLAAGLCLMAPGVAVAVPAFAEQTGQPCAACHVGAFGPQLKQVGRDFKLFGYLSTDGKSHFPPIAFMSQTSFTHTDAPQVGGAAPHFAANDNPSLDQLSIFLAGPIAPQTGAFVQFTYDGVGRAFSLDNTDVRYVREGRLFGKDAVFGVTFNNSPTVQDLWNSTPAWGFPYTSSPLAPTPAAGSAIDGALAHDVDGLGAYALWNDWFYLEMDGYKGLGRDVRNALGATPVAGTDSVNGLIPYWRAALQHEFDDGGQTFELGTYGLSADLYPTGTKSAGTDHLTDTALDFNYQWIADPKSVTSSVVSTHATYIHENLDLWASRTLFGTNGHDQLDTMRADVSYSYDATFTPSLQYFRTHGTNDAARWGTDSGSPNSAGWVAELAYVPWGKPDSPVSWGNARIALQYVAYTRFDGSSARASNNNTLFLNLWVAFAANR